MTVVCPRCGEFCTAVDKWSPCCGVWLWASAPTATDLALRARLYGGKPNGWHRSGFPLAIHSDEGL